MRLLHAAAISLLYFAVGSVDDSAVAPAARRLCLFVPGYFGDAGDVVEVASEDEEVVAEAVEKSDDDVVDAGLC